MLLDQIAYTVHETIQKKSFNIILNASLKKNREKNVNRPIKIYTNKIQKRIKFKTKT